MTAQTGPEALGRLVRDTRRDLRLPIRAAAKLAGVSDGTWRYTETGYNTGDGREFRSPTPDTLERIATALHLDVDDLYQIVGPDISFQPTPDRPPATPAPMKDPRKKVAQIRRTGSATIDVTGLTKADVAVVELLVDALRKRTRSRTAAKRSRERLE